MKICSPLRVQNYHCLRPGLLLFYFCVIWHIATGQQDQRTNIPSTGIYTIKIRKNCERAVSENSAIAVLQNQHPFYLIQSKLSCEALQNSFGACLQTIMAQKTTPKLESYLPFYDPTVNKLNLIPALEDSNLSIGLKEELPEIKDPDIFQQISSDERSSSQVNRHSTDMATILVGTGQTLSNSLGILPGAIIASFDFRRVLPEAESGVNIMNHSYGTDVVDIYTIEAEAYDEFALDFPLALNVFSSGNSGLLAGTNSVYKDLPGRANLTGGFKYAKNILVVGAVDSFMNLLPISSSGPSPSGRMKPEICAFGQDGTSGAAAIASGVSAYLQGMLIQKNIPANAYLLKALLFAGADDIFLPGPDHKTGYGNINASQSINITASDQFHLGKLDQQTDSISFTVENLVSECRIALSWPDDASENLENDLDLRLLDGQGNVFKPLVLSIHASEDSLSGLALPGDDQINNSELILLSDLGPGTYTILVSRKTPSPIPYAVAWKLSTKNAFSWTYPLEGDVLKPQQENLLRFESTMPSVPDFFAEYASGERSPINPALVQAKLVRFQNIRPYEKLRFLAVSGLDTFYSAYVYGAPLAKLNVVSRCDDALVFSANQNFATDSVELRVWQEGLNTFSTYTDSLWLYKELFANDFQYSVRFFKNGLAGESSILTPLSNWNSPCILTSFQARPILNRVLLEAEIASYEPVKEFRIRRFAYGDTITLISQAPNESYVFSLYDEGPKIGTNQYLLELFSHDGTLLASQLQEVFFVEEGKFLLTPNLVSRGEPVYINQNRYVPSTIHLFSANGVLLYKEDLLSDSEYLETEDLPAGVYYYRITDWENSKEFATGSFIVGSGR